MIQEGGRPIGRLGELHPRLADRYELKKRCFVFEVSLDKMPYQTVGVSRFRPFARFPQVQRDLAVVVDERIASGQLERFLATGWPELVRGVKMFDLYRGSQVPAGKKSLAFSLLFGRDDRTLTDEEVDEAWRRIQDSVRREFHAEFR